MSLQRLLLCPGLLLAVLVPARGQEIDDKKAEARAVEIHELQHQLMAARYRRLDPEVFAGYVDAAKAKYGAAAVVQEIMKGAENSARATADKAEARGTADALRVIAEHDPKEPVYRAAYGEALYDSGENDKAYRQLSAAIDLGDASPQTRFLRGSAAERLGDFEQAHADAAVVLRQEPKNLPAFSLLKLTEGKVSDIRLSPDAGGLSGGGKPDSAAAGPGAAKTGYVDPIELARRENAAISKDAFAQSATLTKEAETALKVQGYDEAVRLLDKALSLDPENAKAYHLRATTWIHGRHYSEAIEDATKALALSRGSVATLDTRSLAYNRLGRYTQALADAAEALLRNPRSAFAYRNRAHAEAGLGRRKDCVADLGRAAALDPSFRQRYEDASALPADADLTLFFSEQAETGAPAKRPARGAWHPGWRLYLLLAAAGVLLLVFGLRRAMPDRTTPTR